ncbi:MAG: TIM barrel protein [Sphingomonadales bacterium]
MRSLGLHQITAMQAGPLGLAEIAAATGCDEICVFVNAPTDSRAFPMIDAGNQAAMAARLRDTGVRISNIEYFPIKPDTMVEAWRPALELGASLGARLAVTHIHDPEPARAAAKLDALCGLAGSCGLEVGLEFMGLTPGCMTLAQAVDFVTQLGRDNLAIAVDALHLVRSGGTPADVAALPAAYFAYAQICDGHGLGRATDYLPEALNRAMPGTGDFPLIELIGALPAATPLDVEVPSTQLQQMGISELDHARRAVDAVRAIIAAATPGR